MRILRASLLVATALVACVWSKPYIDSDGRHRGWITQTAGTVYNSLGQWSGRDDLIAVATVIFLTSGTSWSVPANWNSADNSIECIGGGGVGYTFASTDGGGGAYAKIVNLTLTPSGSANYAIGAAGTDGVQGGSTWFNGSNFGTSSVGAVGGSPAGSPGAGGPAASCRGTTKFSGGTTDFASGLGGGGAAGPHGDGQDAFFDGKSILSGAGDAGFGGAAVSSGNGLPGAEYTATAGGTAGSGSGGATGNGGLYGGGAARGSTPAQGLIIITYTPGAAGGAMPIFRRPRRTFMRKF